MMKLHMQLPMGGQGSTSGFGDSNIIQRNRLRCHFIGKMSPPPPSDQSCPYKEMPPDDGNTRENAM